MKTDLGIIFSAIAIGREVRIGELNIFDPGRLGVDKNRFGGCHTIAGKVGNRCFESIVAFKDITANLSQPGNIAGIILACFGIVEGGNAMAVFPES